MLKSTYFSFVIILLLAINGTLFSQKRNSQNSEIERPKLIVGLVIDQMRWDYLYRFYNKYENGGFKRLLKYGFTCENTMINYIPSVTAVGHTTIFTGSVPAIHGIAGNNWLDNKTGTSIYCTDDTTEHTIGAENKAGMMSPRKLLTTTITDELRLATNFQSKVVGISLKDRASVLPAGHNPTAAFWFDDASANFITSSYYMQALPAWANEFNTTKQIDKLLENGWNTLLPIEQYTESSPDDVSWEGTFKGASKPIFPYNLKKAYALDRGSFRQTPFGNTLTLQFAKAAIEGYKLGQEKSCDFLTINCASTDYCGHLVGPNAIEIEDIYLRLDRDLSNLLSYLDQKIGKNKYLVFITADHGSSHAVGFMNEFKMPTGLLDGNIEMKLNQKLATEFGAERLVFGSANFQFYFNKSKIDSLKLNFEDVKSSTINFLKQQKGIQFTVDQDKISESSIPATLKEIMINGYNQQRSGSVVMTTLPGWLPKHSSKGCTHTVWNPYDTHIPLIFMGWNITAGSTSRTTYMTDISATLATLLHIQMPSGCIGNAIEEVIDKK